MHVFNMPTFLFFSFQLRRIGVAVLADELTQRFTAALSALGGVPRVKRPERSDASAPELPVSQARFIIIYLYRYRYIYVERDTHIYICIYIYIYAPREAARAKRRICARAASQPGEIYNAS